MIHKLSDELETEKWLWDHFLEAIFKSSIDETLLGRLGTYTVKKNSPWLEQFKQIRINVRFLDPIYSYYSSF